MKFKKKYFSGKHLYGDNFNDLQLKTWFEEETNAYTNLSSSDKRVYPYHALNKFAYKFLNKKKYKKLLGIGSGDGTELLPIINKFDKIVIIENSNDYSQIDKKINYIKADYTGKIPYADNSFDVVICFSSMHHIANVSFVFSEIYRVLKKNGFFILREPIITMGDWRKKRNGLTKNERGIPLSFFQKKKKENNFTVIKTIFWDFLPYKKIAQKIYGKSIYNNVFLTKIDVFFAHCFQWNYIYHPLTIFKKFLPAAIICVLKK